MQKNSSEPTPSPDATHSRCPRPYNLGRRKIAQDETRRRILKVSAALLLDRGGLAFTIESVAKAASITRQTVHNQFGTRADLLEAVCSDIINVEAFAKMPAVFQQRDPLTAVDLLADIFCRFWEANRRFIRRMRGLAFTEPELESVVRAHDERRIAALRGFVAHYELASGENAVRLVRLLFALTGFELFDALAEDDVSEASAALELKQLLRLCIQQRD
jgi:AcrR family transcriptional regulator